MLDLVAEVLVPFGRQRGAFFEFFIVFIFFGRVEAVVFDLLGDVLRDLALEASEELGVRVFVDDLSLHGGDAFGEELLGGALAA